MTPRKPRCSRWLVRARKRHCCWWSSDPWVALSPARPPVRDAVSGRDARWSLLGIGVLAPPIAELVPAGIATLLDAMRPWSTGLTMVNFHGRAGDATDRARAWPPEIYETIKQAKRRYDPQQHDALRARRDPAQRGPGRRGRTALSRRTAGPVGRHGQVDEVARDGVRDTG